MAMPAEVYFCWKIKSGEKPPCRTYKNVYNLVFTVEISIYKSSSKVSSVE
jgi:hypothetical protein